MRVSDSRQGRKEEGAPERDTAPAGNVLGNNSKTLAATCREYRLSTTRGAETNTGRHSVLACRGPRQDTCYGRAPARGGAGTGRRLPRRD